VIIPFIYYETECDCFMNTKFSRIITTILITGALASSLCACTKDEIVDTPPVDVQLDLSTVVSSADPSIAKYNMYEPINLEYYYADGKAISYNVCSRAVNNKLNIISSVYDSNIGYAEIVLSKIGNLSTDVESFPLMIPDTDLYASADLVNLVGRNYTACVDSGYRVDEIQTKYQCSIGYDKFYINEDGSIYGVVSYSYYFHSSILSESYSSYSSLVCYWDSNGNLVWHKVLPQNEENQSLYIQKAFITDDKYIVIVSKDDTYATAYVYNRVGSLTETKTLSKDSEVFSVDVLLNLKNGNDVVFYTDSDGYTNAAYFNADTISIGDAIVIPDYIRLYGYNAVATGKDYDFVFSTAYGLYGCDAGESELKIMMDFVNSDFEGYYIYNLCFTDNDSFYGVYADMINKNTITAVFKPVNVSDVSDKAIIKLATYNLSSDVRERILNYNSNNDIYRVVVEEYSLYDSVADTGRGSEMLEEAIMSDNAPDLVICNPGIINIYSLVNNGKLTPWNYLVNSDAGFDSSAYYTFVMDDYAINGLDYILVYDFIYRTFIGNTDIVGDGIYWSVNDFMKASRKAPSGNARLYQAVTRDDFINKVIKYNASEYIDYDKKTTGFNCNDFIKLIEYASNLSNEVTIDDPNIDIGTYYRNGDILLIEENVNDSDDFWTDAYRYFDGKSGVVGFPSSNETSSVVEFVNTPIMIVNGDNISGAWNFAKTFYLPEYQYSLSESIPVYYDAFTVWGNKALNDDNYVMLNELGEPYYIQDTYYYNNHEYEIPSITSDNISAIENQILQVTKAAFCDETITMIIKEEVDKYFIGSQTSKDAAKNIDSRVTTYLFE